jgi:hypothetical protein
VKKIEQAMVEVIRKGHGSWSSDNTRVDFWNDGNRTVTHTRAMVYLHDNHIANVWLSSGQVDVNRNTFRAWPTRTAVSRLRALGVDAYIRNGISMIGGEPA